MEEILEIYGRLKQKGAFVRMVAKRFDRSVSTIKNHWLQGSIPAEFADELLILVKKCEENEKKFLQTLQ